MRRVTPLVLKHRTPAPVGMAKGEDIVPIPGVKTRRRRAIGAAAGERCTAAGMRTEGR